VLPVACLVVSLGALLFATASGASTLVLANLLIALGASFGFVGAGFIGSRWFDPLRYGLMFALVQLAAALAALVGQRVLSALLESTPWSTLIGGLGVGGIAVALAMACLLRDPERRGGQAGGPVLRRLPADLGAVLARRGARRAALVGGAAMGTMFGLGVVWGPRLLAAGGLAEAEAVRVASLAWGGLALGSPLFAWVSDRLRSRARVLAAGVALELVAVIGLVLRADASPAELSVWCIAFGFAAGSAMLSFTMVAELVPASLVGTSAAVVNATHFVVGGLLMAVPGWLLAEGPALDDLRLALAVMPAVLALGLLGAPFLVETYDREPPGERSPD
jgi:MFS family permease